MQGGHKPRVEGKQVVACARYRGERVGQSSTVRFFIQIHAKIICRLWEEAMEQLLETEGAFNLVHIYKGGTKNKLARSMRSRFTHLGS